MLPFMSNHGNYTGSLGSLCRWLAGQAEELGSKSSPASRPARCSTTMTVRSYGVATQTWALRDGSHKGDYQPGMETTYTPVRRRARGHLDQTARAKYDSKPIAIRKSMASDC